MPRPSVTLKLATSLDGRIAAKGGASRWITGEAAREQAHRMRAAHGAVLVGAGTARADDPDLRVRLPGYTGKQPVRVVLDPNLTLKPSSRLAQTARETPVVVFAFEGADDAALRALGVSVRAIGHGHDGFDLDGALAELAALDVGSVLVEGGGRTAACFVRKHRVDVLEWFRAPILLGGDGVPAVGGLETESPDGAPRFRLEQSRMLGEDVWETYVPIRK